ncbi:MAG: small subunit ribosomal protein S18, partial [Ilumatobacter sp.]
KKTSVLIIDKVEYIDYKDVDLLRRFMSDRSKIKNRRVAGNDLQQQREVANAIKVAREMALLPYATRVASTRTGGRRDRDDRGGGRGRDDGDNKENNSEETTNTGDDAANESVDTGDAAASTETEA